jgi:hypothetical protein
VSGVDRTCTRTTRSVEAAVSAALGLDFAGDPPSPSFGAASTPAATGNARRRHVCRYRSRAINHNDFSLVRPIVWGLHKTSPHRILTNIIPSLGITFVTAQNVIKKSRLPKSRRPERDRSRALQTTDPRGECEVLAAANKKVNMVRHDHVPPKRDIKVRNRAMTVLLKSIPGGI